MAGTRKYKERTTACVPMELELKTLALHLGIELGECFRIGAMYRIDWMIAEQDPRVSREDIDAYMRLNQQLVLDLKTASAVFDARQSTLAAHVAAKEHRKASGETAAADRVREETHAGESFVWDDLLETRGWYRDDLVRSEPDRFMTIQEARRAGKLEEDHATTAAAQE
jgi:hypothetical protein